MESDVAMLANYHTHTYRCHHASGLDRDYVEKAIETGMRVIGFSDHSPYIFDGDYYSNYRMRPEEAEGYVQSVRRLGKEHESEITVLLGYELEYYPKFFNRTVHFLSEVGCDYLIMGQHFSDNELHYAARIPTAADFDRYVGQVIEGLESGIFTYMCHPDLCRYPADLKLQEKGYVRICEAAKRLDIPVELNMLGMTEGRHYPSESFFRIAVEVGNTIVPGCDAHQPERVNNPDELVRLASITEKLGIRLTELSAEQVLARKANIK